MSSPRGSRLSNSKARLFANKLVANYKVRFTCQASLFELRMCVVTNSAAVWIWLMVIRLSRNVFKLLLSYLLLLLILYGRQF